MKHRVVTPHATFLLDLPNGTLDIPTYIKRFLTASQVLAWKNADGYHSRAGKQTLEMFNQHVQDYGDLTDKDAVNRLTTLAVKIPMTKIPIAPEVTKETSDKKCYSCKKSIKVERYTVNGKLSRWLPVWPLNQVVGNRMYCEDCKITRTKEITHLPTEPQVNCYWKYTGRIQTIC